MGITYIPSPAEGISKSLGSLVEGLDKYLNPNKDLQIAVKRAMATNPELLQRLADLEGAAPGTMAQMGLGNVGNIIASVPQSAAGKSEVAARPRSAEATTTKQGAEITQNEIAGQLGTNVQALMKAHPELATDAAMLKLVGMTQGQRTVEEAKNPLAVASAQTQLKAVLRARDLPEDISKIDWVKEAKAFLTPGGGVDGGVAAAYLNPLNPDTREAFTTAIQAELQNRQAAAGLTLAGMRASTRQNFAELHDNFQNQKAFQLYAASGGVGTHQAWKDFTFDPDAQKLGKELLAGKKPANDHEAAILAVAKENKVTVGVDKLNEVLKINKEFRAGSAALEKATSDEDRDQQIANLNSILDKRAKLGGMDVEMRWVPNKYLWGGTTQFFDKKTGKQLEPGAVISILADPNAVDVFNPPKPTSAPAQKALDMMLNSKIPYDAQLAKMRADLGPKGKAVADEVEQELIRQGLIKTRVTK
jgi:hypothetical protein